MRADFLDDLDLLVAGGGEHDRELGLLLDRSGGGASGRSGRDRDRGGGGDAPLLFEQLGEFGGLEHRQAREFVDDFRQISHCHTFLYAVRIWLIVKSRTQAASSWLA